MRLTSFFCWGRLLLAAAVTPAIATAQAPAWQTAIVVGSGTRSVAATATDAAGNVYVAGHFSGSISVGGSSLSSAGGTDAFVAKWSPAAGAFVWAMRAGGPGPDAATALAVAGSNVYVVGSFSRTANFGSTSLTSATRAGGLNVFVTKLADAGSSASFVWAQRGGGSYSTLVGVEPQDRATAVAVAGAAVYVGGQFTGYDAGFGSTRLGNAGFYSNLFVARLTDAGSSAAFDWAVGGGGDSGAEDRVTALAVNGTSVYAAGVFNSSSAWFGFQLNLPKAGTTDMFVVKLTDSGSRGDFVWARQTGGTGLTPIASAAYALAVNGSSVYVAGNFSGSAVYFGSTGLSGTQATFVAKLVDAGPGSSFSWATVLNDYAGYAAVAPLAVLGRYVYVAGSFGGSARFGPVALTSAGYSDVYVARLDDGGSAGAVRWVLPAGMPRGQGEALALTVDARARVSVSGTATPLPFTFGSLSLAGSSGPATYLASFTDVAALAASSSLPVEGHSCCPVVYPNPARGAATVVWPAGVAPAPLVLFDALGRSVRTFPAAPVLILQGLAPGSYWLRSPGGSQSLQLQCPD